MLTICTHYTLQGPFGDVTELLTFCQDSFISICPIHTFKLIYSFEINAFIFRVLINWYVC